MRRMYAVHKHMEEVNCKGVEQEQRSQWDRAACRTAQRRAAQRLHSRNFYMER